MLILSLSKMMSIGLDAPLLLGNNKVMGVSEVIGTYTYRIGIEKALYSESTAIGLFSVGCKYYYPAGCGSVRKINR